MVDRGSSVSLLQELISLPSPTPPGDVSLVEDWIEDQSTSFGAEVTRQRVEPGKNNLLVLLRLGPGPRLIFNTHMDVNNPEEHVWSSPPFEPTLKSGRIYGCGACDAKGSLAAMLAAMKRLSKNLKGISGELLLTAVMGEEAGGIGSQHLVQHRLLGDGAVVGEPTNLSVARAHKGTYMRKVQFLGRAAHTGRPADGINALLHGAEFCMSYDNLNKRLATRSHPLLGAATATTTIFRSGVRQNTVPDSAEIVIDRRLIPGETHTDADRELDFIFAQLQERLPDLNRGPVEVLVATEPSETPEDSFIVEVGLESIARVNKERCRAQGFSAGCDMSKLVNTAGIPTIICGPGSLEQAHTPDEFVEISQVKDAVNVYENIARRFLAS